MAGKKNIELREKVKLFYDKGLTNTEIAKELGYSRISSISYLLKEMGLKSNYDSNIKLRDIIKPEEYALYQGKNFIAGDYYPSIDHVIPIAKGGTHTWNNVKLAHRICNSIKSDRV